MKTKEAWVEDEEGHYRIDLILIPHIQMLAAIAECCKWCDALELKIGAEELDRNGIPISWFIIMERVHPEQADRELPKFGQVHKRE